MIYIRGNLILAKFSIGNNFVREKTGSATMINLDGKLEQTFFNDNAPAQVVPDTMPEMRHKKSVVAKRRTPSKKE